MLSPATLLADRPARPDNPPGVIGASQVGLCRRLAAYRLTGTPPAHPREPSGPQAAIGDAVHQVVALRQRQRDPSVHVEVAGQLGPIRGEADRYDPASGTVEDCKTVSSFVFEQVQDHGPRRRDLWQVHLYAVMLAQQGERPRRWQLDYLNRDSGAELPFTGPLDPQHVRDAMAWLRQVRDTVATAGIDMVTRDQDPDGIICRSCRWRTPCWGYDPALTGGTRPDGRPARVALFDDDPDAAKWADRLAQARAVKKDAEKLETEAREALQAILPVGTDSSLIAPVGDGRAVRFTRVRGRQSLDRDAVEARYQLLGEPVPISVGSPSWKVTIVEDRP